MTVNHQTKIHPKETMTQEKLSKVYKRGSETESLPHVNVEQPCRAHHICLFYECYP